MPHSLHFLARSGGAAAGLLAGGLILGWLPVLLLFEGQLSVAADSASFNCFALGFLIGAMFGAAAGASAVNRVLGLRVSFQETFVGGLAGLAGGALLEVSYWVALNALNPSLDGWLVWILSAALIYIPVWVGSVIGSGWK